MFPRLRFAIFKMALVGMALLCDGAPRSASAQAAAPARSDKVYRYRGEGGRTVYTNAGAVAVAGSAPQDPSKPALSALETVNLSRASVSQLQVLDRSVQLAHDELQSGPRCQAIRASLRVPVSTYVWREHLRPFCVGLVLLALGLVLMMAWSGRLKPLMPLAPLLGCVYLGYVTYLRIDRRLGTLRDGLHACSSDLPAAAGGDAGAVQSRMASAFQLQEKVDRAYRERAELAESVLRER